MNTLLLDCLAGKSVPRPPVWLMRQAGRYQAEYLALREKHSLMTLFHEPDLICKVTELPLNQFGMDAAILFSDILLVLNALGFSLSFEEGIGPVLANPAVPGAVLQKIDVEVAFPFVRESITRLKQTLTVPLIGFAGAPFTVASYGIEGRSSKDLSRTRQWMYQLPEALDSLLDQITDVTIDLLKMQIDAGADVIQLFDTWAGTLPFDQFERFSLKYLEKIVNALSDTNVPVILFCRGSDRYAEAMAALQPAAIGVDWTCDLPLLRRRIPQNVAIQGNLDPHCLFSTPARIEKEVLRLIEYDLDRFIVNLGHGILPKTPVANVKALVDTVKNCVPSLV